MTSLSRKRLGTCAKAEKTRASVAKMGVSTAPGTTSETGMPQVFNADSVGSAARRVHQPVEGEAVPGPRR